MNDNWTEWDEQVFQMIGRGRSKAGSSSTTELPEARVWEMDNNGVIISKPLKKVVNIGEAKAEEKEPIVIDLQKSKAGSATVTRRVNKAKVIADFLNAKTY